MCNEDLIPCLVFINKDLFSVGDFFEKIVYRNKNNNQKIESCTLMHQNLIIYEQGFFKNLINIL